MPLASVAAAATTATATHNIKQLEKTSLDVAPITLQLVLLIYTSIYVCFSSKLPELVY